MQVNAGMELLTTAEAADYLRLGERKLYELVANNAVPCSKATGKWLFPRHELDRWVLSGLMQPMGMIPADAPPIIGGSQDDLLEWSLRQSGSGLASLTEGTESGVGRLLRGEVAAAAIHFHADDSCEERQDSANIAAVRAMPKLHDAVLVAFARREQGLLLPPGNPQQLHSLVDVLTTGARMAVRQPGAGARMLLDVLLKRISANHGELRRLDPPCPSGRDLAAAVETGKADCGIATRSAALAARLDFVPLVWEDFDLLMRQRTYFQAPLQSLLTFMSHGLVKAQATELTGYDCTDIGRIRFSS